MTTPSIECNDQSPWLDWFNSRESADLINKKSQEALFSTFNADVDNDECIEKIINHQETVYLHKVTVGSGRVSMFHHLVVVGGNLYDSSAQEYGFLQGIGKSTTFAMTFDVKVLKNIVSDTAIDVPTTTNLYNASSLDQIDALTTSDRVTYRPRNFVPVPPFMLKTVNQSIEESNGDAKVVLLKSIEAIKAFDSAHNGDAEYVDKARTKCKDFLFWLFLVQKEDNSIEGIPVMGCSNNKVVSALSSISSSCLSSSKEVSSSISDQVEQSLKRPFEVLAASSYLTSEFMEKLTQLQSQSSDKSSKSFKKILQKYQNMIQVASSISEVTEIDYGADGVEFFKCSNTLNAQVMLNSLFEVENIDCSVSAAVTNSLLYGSFLWKDSMSPSGFAASVLSTEGVLRSDTLYEGMILDYSTKFDISSASLNKLTKTQVLFPVDVEELSHRLRAIQVLAAFFFKKNGFLSQGLKKVVNFCHDNKMMLKTRIYLDKSFIAKFIVAIDDRIHQWLKQCSIRSSVTDTDLTLIEFSSLLSDIQFNRFTYFLPPSIAEVQQDTSSDNKKDQDEPNSKKKKEAAKIEKNLQQVADWKLRNNETWNTVFRHKNQEGPMLSVKCKPCLKYHVKGYCFNDCKQRSSHCVLTNEDHAKTNTFIKTLRGE